MATDYGYGAFNSIILVLVHYENKTLKITLKKKSHTENGDNSHKCHILIVVLALFDQCVFYLHCGISKWGIFIEIGVNVDCINQNALLTDELRKYRTLGPKGYVCRGFFPAGIRITDPLFDITLYIVFLMLLLTLLLLLLVFYLVLTSPQTNFRCFCLAITILVSKYRSVPVAINE